MYHYCPNSPKINTRYSAHAVLLNKYLRTYFNFVIFYRGIEAIVVDYIRPSVFGNAIAKASVGAVYLLSAMTLGGLAYFIYTDVGLINAVKMLWKL